MRIERYACGYSMWRNGGLQDILEGGIASPKEEWGSRKRPRIYPWIVVLETVVPTVAVAGVLTTASLYMK
jgi:hypothetical protein